MRKYLETYIKENHQFLYDPPWFDHNGEWETIRGFRENAEGEFVYGVAPEQLVSDLEDLKKLRNVMFADDISDHYYKELDGFIEKIIKKHLEKLDDVSILHIAIRITENRIRK